MTNPTFNTAPDGPRLTFVGKFFILLFIAGTMAAAYWLFVHKSHGNGNDNNGGAPNVGQTQSPSVSSPRTGEAVEIGVAYGTEKRRNCLARGGENAMEGP